ncbi:MAG: hypothetical protein AB7F40_04640 [Victivallaceae bacterium]|nr:hypothetical protein [Victivallaceae bacterium]
MDAPEQPRSHYREVFANGLLTATAWKNRLFLKEKLIMLNNIMYGPAFIKHFSALSGKIAVILRISPMGGGVEYSRLLIAQTVCNLWKRDYSNENLENKRWYSVLICSCFSFFRRHWRAITYLQDAGNT